MEEYKIVRRPIVTEKGSILKDENNQLLFEVDPGSNKSEIRKAVEKLFKVKVLSVRTQNHTGKKKAGWSVHGAPQELEEGDRHAQRR